MVPTSQTEWILSGGGSEGKGTGVGGASWRGAGGRGQLRALLAPASREPCSRRHQQGEQWSSPQEGLRTGNLPLVLPRGHPSSVSKLLGQLWFRADNIKPFLIPDVEDTLPGEWFYSTGHPTSCLPRLLSCDSSLLFL